MSTLIELTAQIVSAHAGNSQMTSEELFQNLQNVHSSLKSLENGAAAEPGQPTQLTVKQAFRKNEVVCMICNKGGFKTLKKHLATAHQLSPGQYRRQFNIPATQSLAAKSYSESRRKAAEERGLTGILAKARETRAAKMMEKHAPVPAVRVKASVPAVKVKAATPAVKKTASVPAVKALAGVPAVRRKVAVPAKTTKKK